MGICHRRPRSVGSARQAACARLGGLPHRERPPGRGSLAAAVRHDRNALRGTIRQGGNRTSPRAPRQVRQPAGYRIARISADTRVWTGSKTSRQDRSDDYRSRGRRSRCLHPGLPSLLSKVLLVFTLDFERETGRSLAISANVIRILSDSGVRVRELPRLSGVLKEAIKMAVGFLGKRGYIAIAPDPAAADLLQRVAQLKTPTPSYPSRSKFVGRIVSAKTTSANFANRSNAWSETPSRNPRPCSAV
jgi:hypothetical protein